jgi:hypothetical protein
MSLLDKANLAFQQGDNKTGLLLLREFNSTNFATAGSWHQQAVVEEQIGDLRIAGQAHYNCILKAPHIASSYVYGAYWLERHDQIDAAAALYSLAQDADPSSLVAAHQQTEANRVRAHAGQKLLTQKLSRMHRRLFGDEPSTLRIKNAIWTRTHDAPFDFGEHQFAPNLFWVPGINHQAYYPAEQFDWSYRLIKATPEIKMELENALYAQNNSKLDNNSLELSDSPLLRPYLPPNSIAEGDLQALAGSLRWSALDLYREGEVNSEVVELFPKTLAVINSANCYRLGQHPFEVFFSILKPRQSIAPHYGQSNHALTVHLPLMVPKNCYLAVADEKRHWQEGELTIFDDSFFHSAHNTSDRLRIVLIFSIWHPDLSEIEQEAIRLSFKTRQAWMQKRTEQLSLLLGQRTP